MSSIYCNVVCQFYNHWCGHCQRFAPVWRALGRAVRAWNPIVRVAAINCAEQPCDTYQIQGTPTIRIFHPGTSANRRDSAYYGFNVPLKESPDYYQDILLYNLEVITYKSATVLHK